MRKEGGQNGCQLGHARAGARANASWPATSLYADKHMMHTTLGHVQKREGGATPSLSGHEVREPACRGRMSLPGLLKTVRGWEMGRWHDWARVRPDISEFSRGYKVEMANCVGKFRTNVAAIAGSCDCVQLGVWATSWENSAPTLRPLPDHVM